MCWNAGTQCNCRRPNKYCSILDHSPIASKSKNDAITTKLFLEHIDVTVLNVSLAIGYYFRCRQILDQSKSPYANALAASTLTKTISKPSCPILVQERVQIRNYALEYLATRLPLPHFVVVELARLICRIVKIGWFDVDGKDDFVMRDLPDEIGKFLSVRCAERIDCVHFRFSLSPVTMI